jgi:ribose transport system ATP-binding protein
MTASDLPAPFYQMEGISKRYGGVTALDSVDFVCRRGRIHAVLGENGAGKSTLIKIMAGVVQPDRGVMRLDGCPVKFVAPSDATRHGVVCIFQELSLIPDLSVADNMCIDDPPRRWGFIDGRAQRRRAEELLALVGCDDVHPLALVRNLPLSRRQMVEIAGALGRSPKMLILDEATSALTADDVEKIYGILRRLREQGLAIIYISHRMHEIAALADECSVFRNGRHVETFERGIKNDNEIVELMIGRQYRHVFPPKPQLAADATPMLEVRGLSWENRLKDISLTVRGGEIVGLGGLDGQGQRELLLAFFGVLRDVSGAVCVGGKTVRLASPRHAKSSAIGMALIPEDRKAEGLMRQCRSATTSRLRPSGDSLVLC